ncbi:MAG TPA: endonuclease MutS2 [Dehalococcoidia bacterium]|nr:endonuclease MutS2 [Dehalococcoidia bacterium]
MDEKSLEVLEFPKVREILANFTSFSASRHLALNLKPWSDPALISQLLTQSAEARRLLSLEPDFSIRGVVDVRDAARKASRGKLLEPQTLVDIQTTLASARHVRSTLRKNAGETPLLWELADRIVELSYLENDISSSISETGDILDTASPRLSELRYQLKEARQQLLDRLDAIVKSPRGRRILQEPLIVEREGRYVVPVKAEMRKEIKGIVHDISNTGATAFVEPWSTVELGNELRQLTIEEEREVERILKALSAGVGANEADISQNITLLAELDLALAKARYAAKVKATEPVIGIADKGIQAKGKSDAGGLRLVGARHPLLTGKAVPLSVEIGNDNPILVITGPNTGGKTVALKTIGLLTLMTQAGIPIPASEESYIPIFDRIFADIGDEQSIEQTLSTFSWHIGNIVRIFQTSTQNSLVLLDELGTSTDPNEGAALARAILLHFLSRGTIVVATTHYGELKVFAHTTPGMRNASLDFDPVTLAPTYHLTMGIPGGSNALAIASQLGLSSEIIADAREMLAKGTQDMEKLLADLMSEKKAIENLRDSLDKEREVTADLKSQWERELKGLEERERKIFREERDKLAGETAQLQKEVRRVSSELKKTKSQESREQAERLLARVRDQVEILNSRIKAERSVSTEDTKISAGDEVWLPEMDIWGTVLSIDEEEGQIEVQVGQTRLRMSFADAEKLKPPSGKKLPAPSTIRKKPKKPAPSLELDLRGKRADDVAPELDRYLNDASLASLSQVRVIHGFGTGTVRQIVREMLASHPLVKSFRPGERGEGGDGVTIVKL